MKTTERKVWWTSSSGAIEIKIPERAIKDCSHSGPCDADVEAWQPEVDWSGYHRGAVITELSEYGAWDEKELNAKTDKDLQEIILWLACGDLNDQKEPLDYCE